MKTQYLLISLISYLALGTAETPAHYYCGRNLADSLAFMCDLQNMVKRSVPYHDFDFNTIPEYGMESLPWLGAQKARVLNTARGKRQVASECCDKPCTVDELLAYC